MTYSTPAYTGRALDKAFPAWEEAWLKPTKPKKRKPAPKPEKVKRDWLLVGTSPIATRVMIADIQSVVCEHFNVSKNDLLSDRRVRHLVRARQVSMWLSAELTGRSIAFVARQHQKDHTTVLWAIERIRGLMREAKGFADEVNGLKINLGAPNGMV